MLLEEEMIDNNFDEVIGWAVQRASARAGDDESPALCQVAGVPRAGAFAHLTPTKRKRKGQDGTLTKQLLQGRCTICEMKTTLVCL